MINKDENKEMLLFFKIFSAANVARDEIEKFAALQSEIDEAVDHAIFNAISMELIDELPEDVAKNCLLMEH